MSKRHDPILVASELVQAQAMQDNPWEARIPAVSVVWFCYILGGWKALLISSHPDERYYEVTFDKAKGMIYLDTYEKRANRAVALESVHHDIWDEEDE